LDSAQSFSLKGRTGREKIKFERGKLDKKTPVAGGGADDRYKTTESNTLAKKRK